MRAAVSVSLLSAVALSAALTIAWTAGSGDRVGHLRSQQLGTRESPASAYLSESQCLATASIRLPCYDPAQIETAYDERPLFDEGVDGRGQTIVVVDSFGSPTIRRDLATFDAQFHLPTPPRLQIIQPAGAVPPYDPGTATMTGWAGETTLDVEWSHAVAPGADILLVETPVSETEGTVGFPQIEAAELYVVRHRLGDVITQSFGANERTFSSPSRLEALRSAFVAAAAAGVTVVASTGDTGVSDYTTATGKDFSTTRTVTWPASDPLVTAVGGTKLSLDASGHRTSPDQVWNDTYDPVANDFVFGTPRPHPDASGGGLSSIFSRPSYQQGVAQVVGDHRGIPDISMSAACSGLVDTYQSFSGPTPPGWYYVCGTSEAAPLFAGIVALADQEAHHGLGLINPALYAMARAHDPGIVPVTKGDNTVSFDERGRQHTVVGYRASAGYNLASGLGTVDAARFVPELVRTVAAVGSAVTYQVLSAPRRS
ncbi:MAG: S53 family peptidase [Actinomycetota bacterium]|nr:S53 family peptidase [Actinomycetota bacterium]